MHAINVTYHYRPIIPFDEYKEIMDSFHQNEIDG